MRSPKETTGRGDDDDEMQEGERSLKTWRRRGGRWQGNSLLVMNNCCTLQALYMGNTLTAAQLCFHTLAQEDSSRLS